MSEYADALRADIARERQALAARVDELQDRVHTRWTEATDVRRVARRSPGVLLGVALLGGLALGLRSGGRAAPRTRRRGDDAGPADAHWSRGVMGSVLTALQGVVVGGIVRSVAARAGREHRPLPEGTPSARWTSGSARQRAGRTRDG